MISRFLTFFTLAALLTACGCATHTAPVGPPKSTDTAQRNFEAVWDASLSTLREYNFEIDRRNRREGLIVTRPLTGRYFAEFWRPDAATPMDVTEGTIQTIYRVAKVTVRPASPDDSEHFTANVEVTTYRSNLPQPQVTSTSQAYDLFIRPGDVSRRRTMLGQEQETRMVKLGRDEALEREIAAEIAAAPQIN